MISISVLSLVLLLAVSVDGSSDILYDFYKGYLCSDYQIEHALRAEKLQELIFQDDSLLLCAQACSASTANGSDCAYVIAYNRTNSCTLVSSRANNFPNPLPMYTSDVGCKVGKKVREDLNNTITCRNGGKRVDFTCNCSMPFTGRYCEIENPAYCQTGAMMPLDGSNHDSFVKSKLPMTAIIDDDLILPIRTFEPFGHSGVEYYFQANRFLEHEIPLAPPSDGFFTIPFRWKFILQPFPTGISKTITVRLDNGWFDHQQESFNTAVYVPQILDDDRLVFDGHLNGSIDDMMAALSNGYRKYEREHGLINFDPYHSEATYGNIFTKLNIDPHSAGGPDYELPPCYRTYTETLSDVKGTFFDTEVGVPFPDSFQDKPKKEVWDMDKCWTRIDPVLDWDEFASIIKEYVVRGFEFRLIIDGQWSSDITEIQITDNDVIAQLPGFLSNGYVLDQKVISITKRESMCTTDFQGPNVYDFYNETIVSTLDWFVSSKPWVKFYSVNSNGTVLHGEEGDIKFVAQHMAKTIRVCIHYSEKWSPFVTCHGSAAIRITANYGILFQTDPSFKLKYEEKKEDEYGRLLGIGDSDCRQYVKLVSSQGWIHEFGFIWKQPDEGVRNVTFDKMEWFTVQG